TEDRAATLDLLADQTDVGRVAASRRRAFEAPLELARHDRDRRQWRRELVCGARGQSRQRREPLVPGRLLSSVVELRLAIGELARHALQEINDEARGNAESDPHAAKV